MKYYTHQLSSRRIRHAGMAMVLALIAGAIDAAVVVLPNGNRIEGTEIRAQRNGDVILTTPAGQRTFTKGTYTKAIADKPAAFDQARSLASQGKHDEAIALLQKIADDYRFLDWDNNALVAIAQIQTTKNAHKEAVETYKSLFRQSPELKNEASLQSAYREALLKAGLYDELMPSIEEAITKGARADAAKAQLMRGDIRLSKGEVEAAVMDYLRTAILFESETAVHPEALFKAGEGLSQLRDPRAKEMYRKLVEKYPQSSFAQEARAKM